MLDCERASIVAMIKKHLSRFGASARPPEPEPSKTERPPVKPPKEPRHDPYDIARANERQSDFHWGWKDAVAGKPMTSAHSPAYCRGYLAALDLSIDAAHRSKKVEQSRADTRPRPRRFYAKIALDPNRPTPQVCDIAQLILSELDRVRGTRMTLTLDIHAEAPDGGFPTDVESVMRDNAASLRITDFGFEGE
jgi:hypothetical protein